MAIKFTTTKDNTQYANILVYGESGIGKTFMSSTVENARKKVVIISSEKKMLSLKDEEPIPVILVESYEDLKDAYEFLKSDPKAKGFEWVALDSVSDIAEVVLADFKENGIDGNFNNMAIYGAMGEKMLSMVKKLKRLDKHFYCIAKAKQMKDEHAGMVLWQPMAPGNILGQGLPYEFDFVFPLRKAETEKGRKFRYLQTQPDLSWFAKGINGLNKIEEPNLQKIVNKILTPKE